MAAASLLWPGYCSRSAEPANLAGNRPVELFADEVVARGKGFTIKRSQIEDGFIALKATLAAQGRLLPEASRKEIERQLLDRLVNVQLLLQQATEADRERARAKAQTNYETYRDKAGGEEALKRQLIALGMSLDQFRARMLEEATWAEVIDRELKPSMTVSPGQIREYYTTNAARFEMPERVRVSRILILTQDPKTRQDLPTPAMEAKKKLAGQLLARAKAGEDFAKLAEQFTDEPTDRKHRGEMAPFGHGRLVPELDKVVFSLGINQISDLVKTPYGYHIFKMLEKVPAHKVPLAEVENEIRESLIGQEIQGHLPDFLKRLRTEAGVQMPEKN